MPARPAPGAQAAAQVALRALDAALGSDRLTVLAYHRIATVDEGFPYAPEVVSASPEGLRRQLEWLGRNFNPIALDDLAGFLLDGRRLPRRPLLVTFDDGYADNVEWALPALRSRTMPAAMFLITRSVGQGVLMFWDEIASLLHRARRTRARLPLVGDVALRDPLERARARSTLTERVKRLGPEARRMALAALREALRAEPERPPAPLFFGWDRVPELSDAGISCQPHTATHPILTELDDEALHEEIEESARAVEAHTGRAAVALAYPNGEAGDYDVAVVRALREAGLRLAFTMRPGPASLEVVRARPFEIPRVGVRHTDGLGTFALKVAGLARPARRMRGLVRAAQAASTSS